MFNSFFLFHGSKVNLSVSGGTCFLDGVTNDTHVAHIAQPSENTKCSHLIVSPIGLGTALMTIRDIGLSPPAVAFSLVSYLIQSLHPLVLQFWPFIISSDFILSLIFLFSF